MTRRQLFDYAAMSVLWGSSFLVMVKVIAAFGWVGAVTFRAFIASGTLWLFAKALRRTLNFHIGLRHFAVIGTFTVALQLIGLAFSVPRIGTAMAAIFVATIPLFSMIIGQLWGIEHMTGQGRLGLALGFVGMVMLVGFPVVAFTTDFWLGCAASVIGAASAAFGSNYARKFLQSIDSWTQTIGAFMFGGLLTLPLITFVPVPTVPAISDFGYLFLLAMTMSAICYVLYFRMVSELGPTKAISVEFVVTVIAVILGAAVLHERLSGLQVAGSLVILVGCLMVLDLVPHLGRRS